jgi:hypothetical protein
MTRRITLMAASCPSNKLAAVTNLNGTDVTDASAGATVTSDRVRASIGIHSLTGRPGDGHKKHDYGYYRLTRAIPGGSAALGKATPWR